MLPSRLTHRQLSADIHQANIEAGWWTNLETGEPLDRNFGEMLALVHSELSECWRGIVDQCADDHLPGYLMYKVEIADACIRVYDMLGGCFSDLPDFVEFPLDMPEGFISVEDRLVYLHCLLSNALEHFRKSRRSECKMYLYRFLDACYEWAEEDGFDLEEVIREKWDYNRSRADHKLENRLKSDGKKI